MPADWFNKKNSVKIALIAIVFAAFFIRIWNIGAQDMSSDDVLYSIRSIGYVDYVGAVNAQSSPALWSPEPLWWQGLSFHDHPPLVFAIQWLFFKIFGVNYIAARLPFVLAGTLSVLFIFFLGARMFNPAVGLFSAAALAISNYAVWISRIGLLDGFLVLWIILSLYFFIRAKDKPVNYLWWGLFCGLGMLTKYTFIFMAPVFLALLVIYRCKDFKEKWLYISAAAFLLIISPVIIYNAMMYLSRGHFDMTLSSMLGMQSGDMGFVNRQAGGLFHFTSVIKDVIFENFSIGFQILFLLGTVLFVYKLWKDEPSRTAFSAILTGLLFVLLMLSKIGGGLRFSVILLPFAALVMGHLINWSIFYFDSGHRRNAVIVVLVLIGLWELCYAVQTQLMIKPLWDNRLLASANRPAYEGYKQLEDYVTKFYENDKSMPVINFYVEYPQLAGYQSAIIKNIAAERWGAPRCSRLLVFDDHLSWFPSMWSFERRTFYNASPAISLYRFLETLHLKGVEFFQKFGLEQAYFVVPTENASLNSSVNNEKELSDFVKTIEKNLAPIEEIRGYDGRALFRVYSLPLL